VCGTVRLQAQESIRMSLTGAEAAEARRRAQTTPGYYDLNLGMTWWRFDAGLGMEYNDNVYYRPDRRADFIFKPRAATEFFWPITEQNSMNLKLDGGYSAYVEHSNLNRFFIRGSEFAFDLYVGNLWLNVHDRFSITEDVYLDPTAVGQGDLSRFENAAGISALWDLNKVMVRAGYDHLNYISISGGENRRRPDGQNDVFFANVGYELRPRMMLGVEAGLGLVSYEETGNVIFTEAVQWNTGLFFEAPVSEYMKLELGAGYTVFDPELRPGATLDDDLEGIYARATVRHRVNEHVTYSLSGGRNISFTFYGGTIDLYFARLQANWRLLRKVTLVTSFDYDGGTQYDYGVEEFNRYGGGISAWRGITEKLRAGVGYRIYVRDSDVARRNYTVNIASLDLNYRF
jgi:hypothetical protein